MGKLIVYCRAVSYKKNEVSGDCCEMYSFNDGAAQDSISGHPRGITNQISLLYENMEEITHTHTVLGFRNEYIKTQLYSNDAKVDQPPHRLKFKTEPSSWLCRYSSSA